MIVKTQLTSPVAEKAQKPELWNSLLINHPLDCPVCDKGGECPLAKSSNELAVDQNLDFEGVKRTFEKPIAISSQVLLGS